jgi:hypothetical protein
MSPGVNFTNPLAQSAKVLAQSVSPTKLYPTLPVNTTIILVNLLAQKQLDVDEIDPWSQEALAAVYALILLARHTALIINQKSWM